MLLIFKLFFFLYIFIFKKDETPCTEFLCDVSSNSDRKCINNTYVCDGHQDCFDNRDESEEICNYITTKIGTTVQTSIFLIKLFLSSY